MVAGPALQDSPENTNEGNGLTLDLQGRLIMCEMSARRVTRTEKDGNISVLADSYQGKRLNRVNDVICMSDGSICFTDPNSRIAPEDRGAGLFRRLPPLPRRHPYAADHRLRVPQRAGPLPRREGAVRGKQQGAQVYPGFRCTGRRLASQQPGVCRPLLPREEVPDGMKVDAEGGCSAPAPGAPGYSTSRESLSECCEPTRCPPTAPSGARTIAPCSLQPAVLCTLSG